MAWPGETSGSCGRSALKSPLDFISAVDRAKLRKHLARPDGPLWLRTFFLWWTRDHLFKVFPSRVGEATPDVAARERELIVEIVEALANGMVAKLRASGSLDRGRDETTLLRYYPDRAGALVQQACDWLLECWTRDCIRHPRQALSCRVSRVLPRLRTLPNLHGRTIAGAGVARLYLLKTYDQALAALEVLPKERTERNRGRRETMIRETHLRVVQRPISHEELGYCLTLRRAEIARRFACALSIRGGRRQGLNSFVVSFPR